MNHSAHKQPSPVLSEETQKQRIASDPEISSWVGASAGSGKTKVLTDRILRLLLPREDGRPGTLPQKILALTFTKAGANEMALRLSRRLSEWAVIEESKLSKDMETNLLGRPPREAEITAARKLFARVVDTPGGLNIMTVHSFCQSVLGRFPVEAGLPPHFKPLEEEQAHEILEQAKRTILSYANMNISYPLHEAVREIGTIYSEEQFDSLINNIIAERNQLQTTLKHTFGIDGLYTRLCAMLGIRPGLTKEEAFAAFFNTADIPSLRHACGILSGGKSTDIKKAQAIQGFLDASSHLRTSLYATYQSVFITASGDIKLVATKDVLAKNPEIEHTILREAERVLAYDEQIRAIACASTTKSLFILGDAILQQYNLEKEKRGALDFDDLILKTLSLLKSDIQWVLYKLDEGLDHILVDEAQDTNPEQWEIIRALCDDFFSGQGASDEPRTVFVVGDKKQSIFSFQRAAPEKFDQMHKWFEEKIRTSGSTFIPVDINTSFRSVPTVLEAVDAVFAYHKNVIKNYTHHKAMRNRQAGLVELWPLFQTDEAQTSKEKKSGQSANPPGWDIPSAPIESQSGSLKLASKIGDVIKNWIENGEILEAYGRPIQAGDVLVLVRSRNAFVGQLVRALKLRGIPVSGVDRMILGEQLVVQDMVATARFCLLPDDDLTLACLLKSPFIDMSEEALYDLCLGRPFSLWESIKKNGDKIIINWLKNLLSRAGSTSAYDFFSRLTQEPCPANPVSGTKAIHARLGTDALDPLDELLNLAQSYDSNHHTGLHGFLKWHEQGSSEIKRQMEEAGGSVRIMTVHGAKGLQAPIVFLPDTVRSSSSLKPDRILWPHKSGIDVPVFVPSKETAPSLVSGLLSGSNRLADEEYRRLLYVAMTRAEERLYIAGYTGKRPPSGNGNVAYWYEDIRSALENHPQITRVPSGIANKNGQDINILRLAEERTTEPDKKTESDGNNRNMDIKLPAWVFRKTSMEPVPPRPLVPSRPSQPEPAAPSPLTGPDTYKYKRGNITHKLLQILPDLPQNMRRASAEKFLARPAFALPPKLQANIAKEVMDILEDKNFAAIFGPGSMAEIPITGLIGENTLVSGQIDRMVVLETEILIIDYKTNRPPPRAPEDVPLIYIKQMKTYADSLRLIYPSHRVRCALLWTDGATLIEIAV